MLAKLDAIQMQIAAQFSKKIPELLSDRFYAVSTRIPISSFPTLPSRADLWLRRLPDKPKELLLHRWVEFYEKIPQKQRVRTGEEIFQKFVTLRRRMIGAQEKYLPISDGAMCYWETNRRAQKETIVFLHGFADSKDSVYDFAQHMVRDYHLIAPDLPGFGKSFKNPDLNYNIESLTRWLVEWVNKTGLQRFHLVGNSLGGSAAAYLALHMPEQVQTLTLVSPAAIMSPEHPSLYDDLVVGRNLFQIKTTREFDAFLKRVFHRSLMLPPFVKDYYFYNFIENYDWYGQLIEQTFEGVSSIDDPQFKRLLLNHRLPELAMPTHVVWGAEDSLFPASFGDIAQRLLPRSRLTIMPQVGHAPQMENPKEFAKLIRDFHVEHKV
ncbi:MAG: alpha/beta fold hydrolase [Oligoflexus sp.]